MIRRLFFLVSCVQSIDASLADKTINTVLRTVKQVDVKPIAEGMAQLKLSDTPSGNKKDHAVAPLKTESRENFISKLIHNVNFDEKLFIKTTKVMHCETGEWLMEQIHYDEKALKEGKEYVRSIDHYYKIESVDRLGVFYAHLSLVKELIIADRLKYAKVSENILIRQDYASFEIQSQAASK